MLTQESLTIENLGQRRVPSPLNLATLAGGPTARYVSDEDRVYLEVEGSQHEPRKLDLSFEKAGPRERLYFQPEQMRAAIVTCGGLCPGTNNVMRSAVLELHHKYGVRDVIGYRYGFRGMDPASGIEPTHLSLDAVRDIHRQGGSSLGMSRGKVPASTLVDTLVRDRVNALLCIGGDGTQRGALAICEELKRRSLAISVVGVPKTIDNDIAFVDRTFGFETAVEMATVAVDAAHTEARGAFNGVGVVKLMGRDSGFIASAAAMASRDVNFVLIPEVPWQLEGPHGLLVALEHRLLTRPHAVIVIAEGCGRMLVDESTERDASGNVRYGSEDADIGVMLKDAITKYFQQKQLPLTLKYIDPSYMIRGVPANASDSIFCDTLARAAVHAAMAGKTNVVIGSWHGVPTHLPIRVATSERKQVDPAGPLWLSVTEATGQPALSG